MGILMFLKIQNVDIHISLSRQMRSHEEAEREPLRSRWEQNNWGLHIYHSLRYTLGELPKLAFQIDTNNLPNPIVPIYQSSF